MKKTILGITVSLILALQAQAFASDIIAAPNPWVPEGGRTATGSLSGGITFRNLPLEGELAVYTLSGDLVMKRDIGGSSGTLNWNGKNGDNTDVASGVYFWVVRSPEAVRTGKIIVVR